MASVGRRTEPEDVATLDTSVPLRARTAVPEPPPGCVGRPRLDAVLADAVSQRLTLVSAGPGWGKTTAVAAWARSRTDPVVAWLTLESADEDPTAFWADVLTTLRRAGAAPPGHPLSTITVPSRISSDLVRRLLYAVDLLPRPVSLVIDDFHHAGPEVLETVDDLLRYPLPLHLVVLTRVDPILSLQRLRAQGEVAEVGVADLAFSADDVGSLGTLHGRRFEAEQIDHVVADTGGWAVGVRLHIEAYDNPARRARAQRSAAEFLLAEVLERLDPTARHFLLRTSVTSTVCADLAAALDPGASAARLLPELASTNGFVARFDADGSWFEYHPLLREMLQNQLLLEDPDASRDAHRAAARWFARHGEPLRALGHAVESADWDLVGDVFVDVAAAHLIGPRRQAVAEALDRVPYSSLTHTVPLLLCAASSATVAGRFDAALHDVAQARALLVDPADEPASSVLLELIDASAARAVGDVRRLARAGSAALAAADAVPFPFPALDTYHMLGYAHQLEGEAWCTAPQQSEPLARVSAAQALGVAGGAVDGAVDGAIDGAVDGAVDGAGEGTVDGAVDGAIDGAVDGAGEGTVGGAVNETAHDGLRAAGELIVLGARSVRALLEVAAGRLTDGERAARGVVDEASARGWVGHVQTRAALAALAWASLLRGHDDRAGLLLAQARAAASGVRDPASDAATRLLEASLAAVRGQVHAARRALAGAESSMGPHPMPALLADLHARIATELAVHGDGTNGPPSSLAAALEACSPAVARVCRARVLLQERRTGAALRTVEGPNAHSDGAADDLTRTELALVEASALLRTGTRYADRVVERALRAAGPEELVRPFLTVMSDEVQPVLRRAIAGRPDALAQRLRALVPDSAAPFVPLVEPLTERERAILAMLPTMASNLEIAEELFVSVNTVKAHLKSLYRKLGVGSRRDAVRRGRELGILS